MYNYYVKSRRKKAEIMKYLNNLLQDLGITKVKLAKYLGVSRQMIYNYLTFDSVDKWPKEKKILLMQLLDVNDITEKDIKAIKVDTNYMIQVEQKLNNSLKSSNCNETVIDFKGLNKESKQLLSDITSLLRDKLGEDKTKENLYEIYTFGEQVVVMPITAEMKEKTAATQ